MKPFIVLSPFGEGTKTGDLYAISDRFSWLAALFPLLWFLWRGMWLHALGALVLSGLAGAFLSAFPSPVLSLAIYLAIAIWFGLEANNFHIGFLQKQGLEIVAIELAETADMAKELYLATQSDAFLSTRASGTIASTTQPSSAPVGLIFGEN